MNNRKNQTIEMLRFISCIMVVFIHCPFPGLFGTFVCTYGCYAVPFFLMLSGYFSFGDSREHIKKKMKDTVRIITIYGSICILWNCVNSWLRDGSFVSWMVPYIDIKTFLRFVLFNRAVFINSTFYYLFALLYIYAFLVFMGTNLSHNNNLCYLFIGLYFVGYFLIHFAGKAWYYSGNFLFTGIPMLLIGRTLHQNAKIVCFVKGHEIWMVILGVLLTYIELVKLPSNEYTFIGQVLVAISLLCYSINNAEKKFMSVIVKSGTYYSLYIMVFHCEIRDTLSIFWKNTTSAFFPIVVFSLSYLLAFVLFRIRMTIRQVTLQSR